MSDANPLWQMLVSGERAAQGGPFLTRVESKETLSYPQLIQQSAQWAALLVERGVGPGDRVAYITISEASFWPLMFACVARGAALVPISADLHADERRNIVKHSEAKVVVYAALSKLQPNDGWLSAGMAMDEMAATVEPVPCDADTVALIVYTSGTTSASKGVMLSHGNLMAMSDTFVTTYSYGPGMRFLCVLPYYHINAPMLTGFACIRSGSHIFLSDPYGFTNARFFFEHVESNDIEVLSLTPSIMGSLLQLNAKGTKADLSKVRFALVGTAALSESLWRRFEDAFGVPCYQGYGLTETTAWATMTPPDDRKRYDTVGVPIGCELRLSREPEGEIQFKGPIIMRGYDHSKKATRKVVRDDWLSTGDIGRIDEDGQLRVVGRIKNIIKRRGELIFPEEIDATLSAHPDVTAACTVGVTDELAGERVISAFEGTAAPNELAGHIRAELSAHKRPDEIVPVAQLPRNPLGKPNLTRIRQLLSGELAESVVQSFSRYKFARSRSTHESTLVDMAQKALLGNTPLLVAGYWGVGHREEVVKEEVAALDRLRQILTTVKQDTGHVMQLKLILADIHGACNGVATATSEAYFDAIATLALDRGFSTAPLSSIWAGAGLRLDAIGAAIESEELLDAWRAEPMREELIEQAISRCPEGRTPEEHARRYYWVIRTENPAVAAHLSDSIFFTYNGPDYVPLLPPLPTVHWHSIRPGIAKKPWAFSATDTPITG